MPQSDTMPDAAAVAKAATALGRALAPDQAALLAGYLQLLTRFRRKINLVGPQDWPTMLETLVADSWHLADFLAGPEAKRVLPPGDALVLGLDFGAGAGLPGIGLRAFFNRGPYYLLESRQKRCVFLAEATARLHLSGVHVAEGRVERTVPDILAGHPGAFVLCLSRAFAPWPRFLTLCRELVREPLAVVTMTGEATTVEETPPGWALAAAASYPVAGRTRHVSLFSGSATSM
ncbi:glucose inhibited division protein [Solidesulfovibrio fructosivorans JJ]]|uniref:Ribosomal RNA small subunit methyltransferase G n=1 Tax=Solidesulfovibrio fructosivorans JJ] TaxID=596151 RepID=E1JYT5_SOLFR|nr:RsmG family class I SAM-dependent methyltransferase [Solidesulfovibrio fructosivorans]EFL50505.1 glucose inhibited division protein [Solidesulfovibrio fructosivorans JJ]]